MLPYPILCELGELFVVFQAVIFFLNHFLLLLVLSVLLIVNR